MILTTLPHHIEVIIPNILLEHCNINMALVWWEYLLMALSLFIGCVFLNYLVKKFNEARLDERFNRLLQKTSNNRSTQAEESSPMEPVSLRDDPSTNSAREISFVYNKEQNLKSNDNVNSNLSSHESSEENSKLKFLGKIYSENNPLKSNVFTDYKCDSNTSSRKSSNKDLLSDQSDKEFKTWVQDLLISHLIIKS